MSIVDLPGSEIVYFVSGVGDTPDSASSATIPFICSNDQHVHRTGSSSSIPDTAFDS
jgi:hypothetical protein